jgi:uncharacterized membrane protein HdeD (DUF308 family)
VTAPTWPDGTAPGPEGTMPTEFRAGTATEPPAGGRRADDPATDSGKLATAVSVAGRHWGLLIALGVLSVVGGLAILVWPEETVLVVAVLIGLQLLVNGVVRLVQSFAADDAGGSERVLLALLGIFSILVGVLCLRNILQAVAALAVLVGLFWLVGGIIDVIGGLLPGSVPGRGWRLLSGALSVIAGIVLLAYPGISLAALVVLLGIWLLLYGAIFIGMGLAVRRETRVA